MAVPRNQRIIPVEEKDIDDEENYDSDNLH